MENNKDHDSSVEYVEAEPIETETSVGSWKQQPEFRTYTANARSCNPCCGPLGCLILLSLPAYAVAKSEFLQNMILAFILTLGLMALMVAFTRKT